MKLVVHKSTCFLAIAILCYAGINTGCKSKPPQPGSNSQETSQQNSAATANPQLNVDDLVAPIALYPDQLLAQVLTTAVNPQEVLDLGNWLLQNQNLKGDAMTDAAKQAGFSPSAQYLTLFPQVVDNMCQQMDWTKQVGEAFKADQKGVMDAVQRKRAQAEKMGNLDSSQQMTVENKKADNGESYVEIKSADPKVVYVPQYNPVTIYNSPAPAAAPAATTTTTTTAAEKESGVSNGEAAAIGLLSFGVGMALGSAINNNNDYYPYPAWGSHAVYVGPRPYYPAAYRAPVYAGYRPAYGYNPPGNYRWNQYNRNINMNVNNNYYNRFNNTNVNRTAANTRYNNQNGVANTRPVQNQANWKGQTSYQGARSTTPQRQSGASMANANPRNQQSAQRSQISTNRPNESLTSAASRSNARSANSTTMAANRPSNTDFSRSSPSTPSSTRQAPQTNTDRGGDRGYGGTSSASSRSAASGSSGAQTGNAGGAFGGGSGKQERAASERGRASAGTRGGGRRR
jgi:hypothetical protein